ncbi:canine-like rab-type small G protein [Reticulomyxa filosa]|uniref:Canine-like rab-type small G protein n=1 Tax=Reticulomyxa filosa TaxID=46433 RepID=X6N0H1_RETFI|nr:canine-like rab-type small G protein [Reticulomyxa filosa]|eukprot:ETO19566.1 canine-like rab-type small G protein [Reticulomyxa filosa]
MIFLFSYSIYSLSIAIVLFFKKKVCRKKNPNLLKMTETYKFKVVLLGEGRVGKTSLLLRFVENRFSDRQQSTLQASYLEKTINIGSCSVTLAIWDTAGQVYKGKNTLRKIDFLKLKKKERFHALAPIYYRDADGAILVFDITDQTSFNKVQNWVEELRKIVGDDILVVVASNKQDLESKRQVRK